MADSVELSKRIDYVFELSSGAMRKLWRPRAVLAFLGLPAMCLAATLGLRESPASLQRIQSGSLIKLPSASLLAQVKQNPAPAAVPQPKKPDEQPPERNALRPRFETASLEVAGVPVSGELCWGGCGGPLSPYPESRNQITYRHFTLRKILLRAYNVRDYQIVGPSFLDTTVYNLDATAAPGTTQEVFQAMLRNLLAERLQLKIHEENRDFISGYDLTVTSRGPKLKEAQGPEASVPVTPFRAPVSMARQASGLFCVPLETSYNCSSVPSPDTRPIPTTATSVPALSILLTDILDSPVTDKTGLLKRYAIDLTQLLPADLLNSQPRHVERHAEEPAFYPALRSGLEQMGLMLEEKRISTDLLIIDNVESLPGK